MAKTDPVNVRHAVRKYSQNYWNEGAKVHIPCPWCCEPDFYVMHSGDAVTTVARETTCRGCGRTGKTIFDLDAGDFVKRPQGRVTTHDGEYVFEFVQTAGEDPPHWLKPTIRRV